MDKQYTQLCVWHGCLLGEGNTPETFETFMRDKFGVRVKFAEEVETIIALQDAPGKRHDLFFYVHSKDISKFAVKRLMYGIRWWEDVLGNGNGSDYSPATLEKYPNTWKEETM